MKNQESKNGIITLLIVIIIILICLIVLFASDMINFNSNSINNNTQENSINSNNSLENKNDIKTDNIDYNNLKYEGEDVSDGAVERIIIDKADSIDLDYDYFITMTAAGKIKVSAVDENGKSTNSYLNNVNNVIDIIHFSVPSSVNEQLIYILLNNGEVYYYRIGDSINNKYTATKVENISNVEKLFIHYGGKENAGGWWTLIAVTNENKLVALNSEGV